MTGKGYHENRFRTCRPSRPTARPPLLPGCRRVRVPGRPSRSPDRHGALRIGVRVRRAAGELGPARSGPGPRVGPASATATVTCGQPVTRHTGIMTMPVPRAGPSHCQGSGRRFQVQILPRSKSVGVRLGVRRPAGPGPRPRGRRTGPGDLSRAGPGCRMIPVTGPAA